MEQTAKCRVERRVKWPAADLYRPAGARLRRQHSGQEEDRMSGQGKVGATVGLRQMKVGQRGSIVSVKAEGELGRRIRDMGLIPGTDVEVVGHAPLRDPVALRLFGVTLALRNREADYIMVEVC